MLTALTALLICAAGEKPIHAAPAPSIPAQLQPFVDRGELAGAVAVVAGKDQVLAVHAVGFADVTAKRPMKTDAVFWIASQSKPITGVALMILVDEGKLSLDDPVAKYLPEFKEVMVANGNEAPLRPTHAITVREVMCHTSGMPFKSAAETPTLDALPLREAVLSYAKTPLLQQPGTKYVYSNAGINTGARIVEVISKQSFEAFMDERLFQPLGMKDTTFWPNAAQMARLATPHRPNAAKTALETTRISQMQYPLENRKGRYPMPAGGLFSTGADVARLCRMVLNGGELDGKRYLSAAAVKQMTSRQTPAALKESYGVGWAVTGASHGHGGALATNMSIDPQRGIITIWLVQHAGFVGDGAKAQGVFRQAAEAQFGAKSR